MDENSPLLEAIALWEDLTGVSPPDAKGFWSTGGGTNTWAIRDTYTALKEALELDPSEVTATLLFKRFIDEYLRSASTSMMTMIEDPTAALKQLETAKRLLAIVDREEIVEAREAFIASLTRGLASYGADQRADVQTVLANSADLAILRRDALRSLEKLRVDQFLDGENEAQSYRPVYVNEVHLWWNVNSLLKAMTAMPSGVSLNMIRDPNAYESYFAFAIRNGGNLFVLTDVPEHAHPLQSTMMRKPGRDLDRRIAKNWFPYDLLGMEVDEKGDSYKPTHSDETAIVAYQPDTFPMKKIAELPPHETIWTVMMLDLIVLKFWKRGFKAKQLSYTGEMIKVQDTLLLAAAQASLPMVVDKPLEMPALTITDVTGANLDDAQIGRQYDSPNQWLEERYKHLITGESLNLLAGPGEVRKLLAEPSGETTIAQYGAKEKHDTDENGRHLFSDDQKKMSLRRTELVTMSGTKFGTPAELEADRRFLARYNVARQVKLHAAREFAEREAEVKAWFKKRVIKNKATLIQYAINKSIWLEHGRFGNFAGLEGVGSRQRHVETSEPARGEGSFPGDKLKLVVHDFIQHYDLTLPSKSMDWSDMYSRMSGLNMGGDYYDSRGSYRGASCAITEARASTATVFFPSTALEIAVLCGCTVEDLPDVLQTWAKMTPYRGNSILSRIDPMVWVVENPWHRMDFRVRIPFSILGRRKAEKAGALLPPLPNIVSEDVVFPDGRRRD
jgi:hypothetical protein